MGPLIANETKHMLEHLAPGVTVDDITDIVYVKWVAGGDGSGRHPTYRACKTDAGLNNHNFILGGMRIEWIKNSRGKIIYLEKQGPFSVYGEAHVLNIFVSKGLRAEISTRVPSQISTSAIERAFGHCIQRW